jgi:hypothetical protein
MNRSFAIRGLAVFAALGFASGAVAQTAPGMGDLIGARGSSVESELQARGYEFATNLGSAALWWNAKTKACVSVAVDQGRVQSIQQASASDCGKSESHSSSSNSSAGGGSGLDDLVGARGSSAESELQARGYKLKGHLGSAALWWNPKKKSCVSVAVDEGRVQSIMNSPAKDCGK